MIAPWMVYTLLVGGLVSIAALAAERAVLLLGAPVRWVWAAALGVSLLVPCLGHFLPRGAAMPPAIEQALLRTTDLVAPQQTPTYPLRAGAQPTGAIYTKALLIGWGALSLALAQLGLYSMAVLKGRRREWRRQTVDGVETLVARDFGPAVVGWRRLEIVLPAWAMELAGDARALILRHEQEHVRQRDPRLLIHASLIVLAMPWNPALWWQYRRLRRAIELDCDARVVRGGASVARYGAVLLEAGGFCQRRRLPALAAFAERAADLEARIKALTPRRGRWRIARVSAAVLAAGLMMGAAGMVPDPLGQTKAPPTRIVSHTDRPHDDSANLTTWVRAETRGVYTNSDIVLFRSHDGRLMGSRWVRGVYDNLASKVKPDNIERVDVLKGPAVPNVGSVVVITLKTGAQLSPGTDDSFSRILQQYSGCWRISIYPVGDIDGVMRCRDR